MNNSMETNALPTVVPVPETVEKKKPGAAVKRGGVIDIYERKLAVARWGAWVVGALQNICRFLAYCNLTWATVVLLGGFVSSLTPTDLRVVTSLLLVEAGRLASTLFFSRLVRRALVRLSQNPPRFKNTDIQPYLTWALRRLSQFGQILFILPSIGLPIYRMTKVVHSAEAGNLQFSLEIFYILALINAGVGLVAVMCSVLILSHLYDETEESLQRYYDVVLQRTLDDGIVQADDFDFFDFVFTMLGKEFARNLQPPHVQKQYKELLRYMYAHRQGIDALLFYLDSGNTTFVQLAAANVVGFWAELEENPIRLPTSLLTKLADKLGHVQLGWAATNSFTALAKKNLTEVLDTKDTKGTEVLVTFIQKVEPLNSRSLVIVRCLISMATSKSNEGEDAIKAKEAMKADPNLAGKLQLMLKEAKVHRQRVLAGFLLLEMGMLGEGSSLIIDEIDPTEDHYIYQSELDMLNKSRRYANLQLLDAHLLRATAKGKGKPNFSIK